MFCFLDAPGGVSRVESSGHMFVSKNGENSALWFLGWRASYFYCLRAKIKA
jgi:hypothetical protein